MGNIKWILSRLKPYLRWIIFGGTLFFLAKVLKENAAEVAAIRIDAPGAALLAIALGVTLLAHIWSGWVWSWILQTLNQPVKGSWGVQVYLKTNIAKYIPGNIWHLVGRIKASTEVGIPLKAATLSVLLEPLLMAAAALLIALWGSLHQSGGWQILSLATVLTAIHPQIMNPALGYLGKLKAKTSGSLPSDGTAFRLKHYPLLPLLGELGFLGLRGFGFLLTLLVLSPVTPAQIPLLFSAFSIAWLLGLVIPGAPGGIGVFEATALTILGQDFSTGLVLSTVALYRLVSILAELAGALLASLDERLGNRH